MRLTIAYSRIKKGNQVLINNVTHQSETLSERPIRQPLKNASSTNHHSTFVSLITHSFCTRKHGIFCVQTYTVY